MTAPDTTPPEPTCAPPEGTDSGTWHWISGSGGRSVWRWDGRFWRLHDDHPWKPEVAAVFGHTYLGLVRPYEAVSLGGEVTDALHDVAAERRRQVVREGFSHQHDDEHSRGELALAAACYADHSALNKYLRTQLFPRLIWPWDMKWWKPTTRRHDAIKAAALLIAEIERLDRASLDATLETEERGGLPDIESDSHVNDVALRNTSSSTMEEMRSILAMLIDSAEGNGSRVTVSKKLIDQAIGALRATSSSPVEKASPEGHLIEPAWGQYFSDRGLLHCEGRNVVDEAAAAFRSGWHERAALRASPVEPSRSYQSRVHDWLIACFGPEIAIDKTERNHRFLEEALEVVQSAGCTRSEAHQLVNYVFGRPTGDLHQEVGGVMNTLVALCLAHGLDMDEAAETELVRVWSKVETIRAKQKAKPKHSPLPQSVDPSPDVARRPAEDMLSLPEVFQALYAYAHLNGLKRTSSHNRLALEAVNATLQGRTLTPVVSQEEPK